MLWAGVRAIGKLTLCDLAGSERITKTGATGAPHLRHDDMVVFVCLHL